MVCGELFLMVTPPPVVDPEDAGVLLEDEDETADEVLVGTVLVDEVVEVLDDEVESGDGVGVGVELEVVGARVEMDAVC
jgi:hypothetical protein